MTSTFYPYDETHTAAFLSMAANFVSAATKPPGEMILWYDKPATQWEQALPVGNGHLGAMVFGGLAEERIQFNEDTVRTGKLR